MYLDPPLNRMDLPALMVPIILIACRYPDVVGLWWQVDDALILNHALAHAPWTYFLDPFVWRQLSPAHLTPWVSLSFDLDLSLFGIDPQPFYVHQLVSLGLAAMATYLLLRLWVRPWVAALTVTAFLAGAPLVVTAFELMTRHYVEGLVLAVAAIYLFVVALRSDQGRWALIGAACYLLAATAKEIFVPLVGVLLFLPESNPWRRFKFSVPYLVVAVLYVPWRILMLGTPVGGYGGTEASVATAWTGLTRAGAILFGNGSLAVLAGWSLLAGLIWTLAINPRRLVLIGAIGVAATVPVAFVAPALEARHLVGVWWTLCVASAIALSAAAKMRRWGPGVAALLIATPLVAIIPAGRDIAQSAETRALTYAAYGHHWLSAGADTVVFVGPPIAGGILHYFRDLSDLAERVSGPRSFPTLAVDEIDIADIDLQHRSVWTFDPACVCMRDITADVPAMLASWKDRLVERPLSVEITSQDGVTHWRFGPYQSGTYRLVDARGFGRLPLPPSGERRTGSLNLDGRIRYDAPEGWTTYSPRLHSVAGSAVNWRRK